jgi:type IV pilus assembly protein PilO
MKIKVDFSIINKIPKKYQLIIIFAFNIVLFGVVFYFLIMPQIETKDRLAKEYDTQNRELAKLINIKNNMDKFRQEYSRMKEALGQALSQMPEQKDIPKLLRNVSYIGAESGLKVIYFEPKPPQSKEFYEELPFEMRYTGSYHNIGYFFDGIRNMERIVHVPTFSIEAKVTPTKIVIEGSCIAKTFIFVKEKPKEKKEEKKGQKEEKSAAPKK